MLPVIYVMWINLDVTASNVAAGLRAGGCIVLQVIYLYHPCSNSAEGGIIFSSVCMGVRICERNNSWTVRDIVVKFLWERDNVRSLDLFENDCIPTRV